MKTTNKKASGVTRKSKKASTVGRTVLYANIADSNRNWVSTQAKKAGVSKSMFTDAVIQFAKKNKFAFTKTGRV